MTHTQLLAEHLHMEHEADPYAATHTLVYQNTLARLAPAPRASVLAQAAHDHGEAIALPEGRRYARYDGDVQEDHEQELVHPALARCAMCED